jgi:hypothetical protein
MSPHPATTTTITVTTIHLQIVLFRNVFFKLLLLKFPLYKMKVTEHVSSIICWICATLMCSIV